MPSTRMQGWRPEFFVTMPSKDYTARSFVPDWSPHPGVANRMERVWLMTSKHVVHMSRDRVPTDPGNWRQEDTTYGALMRITRDANKCLAAFADAYAARGGPHAEFLSEMVTGVRPFSLKERAAARRAVREGQAASL